MHKSWLAVEIAFVCLAMAALPAFAQTTGETAGSSNQDGKAQTKEQEDRKATGLQEVIVTGTRASDRTASYSLAPIDVLSSEDLINTGQPSFARALRTLLPAFSMPQAAVRGSATQNIRPAQLRGLPPDNTLVLINGKRMHTTAYTNTSGFSSGSSPVDLNSIPMAAVERVEVLRDGAAALYGSDAVAGVINIILREGVEHGFAQVAYGQWDGNQGGTWRSGASGGFSLGDKGWVRLSANYLNQNMTNHAGLDNRYPGDPTYGQVTMEFGLPKSIDQQFALNAEYSLGDNATVYAFSTIAKRRAGQASTFRSLSQYKDEYPEIVPLVPDGFLTRHQNRTWDDNSTLGVRGQIGAWDYDFSVTSGGNHWKQDLSDTVNESLGADSPRDFYAGTTTVRQNIANADFRREFNIGLEAPISFAWGLAYRQQKYIAKAGEWASFEGVGEGIKPDDAGTTSRNNKTVYVDVSADPTSKFSTEVNARYERYSDFGSKLVWGLKGRYQFTPSFAMRGTVATGFRAPSVQMEGYSETGVTFVHLQNGVLAPFKVKTFQVNDPAAVALGARPLKPETSRTFDLGLVITPYMGLNLTIDAYQVNIDDTIAWTSNLVGPDVRAFLEGFGIYGVNGGRFASNLTDRRVRGVDMVGSWPIHLERSMLNVRFGYNYNTSKITSVKPHPEQWDQIGLNPVLGRGALTPNRRTKGFVGASWQKGNWSVSGRVTRYSSWTARSDNPVYDMSYGARYLSDLSVNYLLDQWRFTMGGDNIFNVYPERNTMGLWGLDGNIVYPNDAPMGYNGRYIYASVGYQW